MSFPRRAIARVLAVIVLALAASASVYADTLPAGAVVPAGPSVDLSAFTRAVASRYHVVYDRVIAADIDRDGDIDVIGADRPGLVVWLNDGDGHLTSQAGWAPPARGVERLAGDGLIRRQSSIEDDPLQNDSPSALALPSCARDRLEPARPSLAGRDAPVPVGDSRSGSSPRAPPPSL